MHKRYPNLITAPRVAHARLNHLLKLEHMLLDAQLSFCRSLAKKGDISEGLTNNDMQLLYYVYEEVHGGKEK